MAQSQHGKIGVITATIIGMNAMIGSGIFTAPAAMASHVGPAGILAYLFVVFAVWFIAISLARLAALFPEEGSFYVYVKPWAGHLGGLIASGAYFAGLLIAMGALSQVAGSYLQDFFPSFSAHNLGLIVLLLLVFLNMFGVVLSEIGQHILIVCTIFPLLATTLVCFYHFDLSNLTPFAPHGLTNVLKATRIVIFGFFGFECAASLFNIVAQPETNVPRALTYSIAIVGSLYTLFIASIILSTPLALFSNATIRVPEIIEALHPHATWLIIIVHIAILSAILGTVHSMIWTSSNLLVSLVKRLKSSAGRWLIDAGIINSKSSVLIVGLCITISYIFIANIDLFFYLTAFFIVLSYIMSMITLLLRTEEWRSGQNVKTTIGIATALLIFIFAAEGLIVEIMQPDTQTSPIAIQTVQEKGNTQD
jgi:amino acid transporter